MIRRQRGLLFGAACLMTPLTLCVLIATAQPGTTPPGRTPPGSELPQPDPADNPQKFKQDYSYGLGLTMGRDLMSNEVPVDANAMVAGILDALKRNPPKLNDQQLDVVMKRFDKFMRDKVMENNKKLGAEFMANYLKQPGVKKTDSGMCYRVVTEGAGATPGPTSAVSCNYEGKLVSGQVFDSTRGGQPAEFPVNRVIPGWTEMLQLMKEGGKVEVVIPSDLAYGDSGYQGIGPGETLVFEIELLKVLR